MSAEMDVEIEPVCSLPPGCGADGVTTDGHVFAFWAGDDGRLRFLWDGVAGEPFDSLGELRDKTAPVYPSDDGAHVAYIGVRGASYFVGRDGTEDPPFANLSRSVPLARIRGISVLEPPLPARFSPDSQRFAYFADVVEKGVAIVEDDVPGPLLKELRAPVFSPDSRHLAYVAQTYGKKTALVLDGAVSSEWDVTNAGEPVFSSDSRRVAVGLERVAGGFLRKRKLYSVSVDGRSFPEEPGDDASFAPAFNPDGTSVAWWIQRGTEASMVIDGVIEQNTVAIESDFRFDGTGRVVYAGRSGSSQTIVVDGRPGPLADAVVPVVTAREAYRHLPLTTAPVPFRISAYGAHVMWAGIFDGAVRPVLDDEVGPAFDLIHDCSFDKSGSAVWWAQRGQEVVRVMRTHSGTAGS